MKRFYTSIIIIIMLAVVTVYSHILVENTTKHMLCDIQSIGTYCDNGNFTKAKEKINELESFCKKREHWLALFIKRDYVSAVIVSCATFKAYAQPGSEADLHAELDRSKLQIETTHHLFFSIV